MATDLPEARSSGASSYSCGQPAVASFSTARRRGACASAQGRISPLPSEQVTCTQEWRIKIKHAERRAGLRQDACVAQRQCACRPLGHARTLPGLARAVAAPFSSNFVQIRPLASAAPHQRGSSRTAATARGTLYLRAHRHGTDQSFATAAVRRSGIKSVCAEPDVVLAAPVLPAQHSAVNSFARGHGVGTRNVWPRTCRPCSPQTWTHRAPWLGRLGV